MTSYFRTSQGKFIFIFVSLLTVNYFHSQLTSSNQLMSLQVAPSFLYIIIPVILLFTTLTSLAQRITNADSLSKNTFAWNQEEKEFGFAHFDEVFNTRDVPKGKRVHKLPQGRAIAAFNKGGQKEKELDVFITEQKVAGILILQEGKIRLERYAFGFSEAEWWTSQSVPKSVTSTLVGAAIKDGYIKSIDEPC